MCMLYKGGRYACTRFWYWADWLSCILIMRPHDGMRWVGDLRMYWYPIGSVRAIYKYETIRIHIQSTMIERYSSSSCHGEQSWRKERLSCIVPQAKQFEFFTFNQSGTFNARLFPTCTYDQHNRSPPECYQAKIGAIITSSFRLPRSTCGH